MMKKKIIWTTIVTTILWVILLAIILSGFLTIQNFDVFNRMTPDG